MLKHATDRAKKKQVGFDLCRVDIESILQSGLGQYTGIEFDLTDGPRTPWSPTLDRLNNDLGYTKDNVQVVVWAFNAFKNQWDKQTYLLLLQQSLLHFGYNIKPQIKLPVAVEWGDFQWDLRKLGVFYEQVKHIAKDRGIPFDLTKESLKHRMLKGYCEVTKIPLDLSFYHLPLDFIKNTWDKSSPVVSNTGRYYSPWSPSVDHIIPRKEEINVVCWAYNAAKSDFYPHEFKKLLECLAEKEGFFEDPENISSYNLCSVCRGIIYSKRRSTHSHCSAKPKIRKTSALPDIIKRVKQNMKEKPSLLVSLLSNQQTMMDKKKPRPKPVNDAPKTTSLSDDDFDFSDLSAHSDNILHRVNSKKQLEELRNELTKLVNSRIDSAIDKLGT